MVVNCRRALYLIVGLVILSCNKTTSKEVADESINQTKTIVAAYPHEKDFFKNHGLAFTESKDQCLGCHGQDGSGGTAKTSCLQCHQGFPHPKNWVMPDQHPLQFLKSPQSCSVCHGEDWKGGKSKVSCLQCHQGYPHPLQWAVPSQHGKAYVESKDKSQCLNCHDQSNNKAIATRCDTCHKAFPHDDKFMVGGGKHKSLASTYDGKCLVCHQGYKQNMPNYQDPNEGLGCFGCHEGSVEIHWFVPPQPEPTSVPVASPSPDPISMKLNKKKARIPSGASKK